MKIKLGGKRGGYAIVSDVDYEELSEYSWHLTKGGYVCGDVNGKFVRMHRYIMKALENTRVDHINKIKYDNRRKNLRIADVFINAQNKTKLKNTSSEYRNVSYDLKSNKYYAVLVRNKKTINLGLHDKEINAAEAVDMYLVHNSKDKHLNLNFPDKYKAYLKRKYVPYSSKQYRTKYFGLTRHKYGYYVSLTINKKYIYIGFTNNVVKGAKMRDKYIVDNNLKGRKLNFPEDYPNYNTKIVRTTFKIVKEGIIRLINKNLKNVNAIIDLKDYNKVKYHLWYNDHTGYIVANINRGTVQLSRYIMNVTDQNIFIDHIDRKTLNNTRSNLRISNPKKNPQNRTKIANTSSKYIGVTKKKNRWVARIRFNGKLTQIGSHIKEIDAARARDLYILDNLLDEHYNLNFEWDTKEIFKWKNALNIQIGEYFDLQKHFIKEITLALDNNNLEKATRLNQLLKF